MANKAQSIHKILRCMAPAVVVLVITANSSTTLAVVPVPRLQNWAGNGPERAIFVVEWNEAVPKPALAWGFRFAGTASSLDMILASAAADPGLYLRLGNQGPFGTPLYGIGYDRDNDGFALSDGTVFQNGVAYTGPSDGATAVDPDDSYQEGWFDGFWGFFVSSRSVPVCDREWELAGGAVSDRFLRPGDWDGFGFSSTEEPLPPRLSPKSACRDLFAVRQQFSPGVAVPEVFPWTTSLVLAAGCFAACRRRYAQICCLLVLIASLGPRAVASDFASLVVSYDTGTGVDNGFTNPAAALGSPTRFTSPNSPFGGAVTPFQSPFAPEELVSIGFGGQLTLMFDRPIVDRPESSWWGADLIVFGNAFYFDSNFPNGIVGGLGAEPGTIEVSQDGTRWYAVQETADGAFPTMGYQDVLDPFPLAPGSEPTDFHRPVNPSLDPTGLNMAQLIDAYDGSGGGVSVDISPTGLPWIQFIRFTNLNDPASGITPEIDAVSIVPEPASPLGLCTWMWCFLPRLHLRVRRFIGRYSIGG